MIRVLWFAFKLAVLVALAYWLAERPGEVSVDWLGYRIETSVGILLAAMVLIAGLSALSYRAWRFLRRSPRSLGHSLQAKRRKRGYKALTQGMVAVAAGEVDEATRQARRAGSLLEEPPLTMLLSAQAAQLKGDEAAQLKGDEAAAKRYFTAMMEDPETRFLGLRGLVTQALREGDEQQALDYVRQAHAMRPRTPWVLTSLFDLSERCGDLETAERTLVQAAKAKALPAPEAGRKRAVILLERAQAAARGSDRPAALAHAREANKLAPGLIPGAVLLAAQLIAAGQRRKAAKVLERAWAAGPHPELAALYLETQNIAPQTGGDGIERLKRLGQLTGKRPDHPESHLVLARAALEARLWGEARRHIKAAAGPQGLEGAPSDSVCRLMAELEEQENGDTALGREWLTRSAGAPKDPAWVCTSCGAASPGWSARCGACESFDSLAWQTPPQVAPALPALAEGDGGEAAIDAGFEADPAPALPIPAAPLAPLTKAGPRG